MKKQVKFAILTALLSLFAFTSCESEAKTYLTYSLSIKENSYMTSELSDFVVKRSGEINKSSFGEKVIESQVAQAAFTNFCDKLDGEAVVQQIRVFGDTWVVFQLSDIMGNVVAERKVLFTKNADPKRYVKIVLEETYPRGDTDNATLFLDSKLVAPFSMTKSSKTDINTYTFYREYSTYEEAKSYLESKESDLKKLISQIDKQWPVEALYTSKLILEYVAVDEATNSSKRESEYIVLHKPYILGAKGWATDNSSAPEALFVFTTTNSSSVAAPYFVSYKTTISGVTYDVLRSGKVVGVMNSDGTIKYGFVTLSATTFQLMQLDGVDVTNGAIYTKVE